MGIAASSSSGQEANLVEKQKPKLYGALRDLEGGGEIVTRRGRQIIEYAEDDGDEDNTSPESEDTSASHRSDFRAARPPPIDTSDGRDRLYEEEAVFTPSYRAYTPTPTHDIKYKSPDRRVSGVFGPPSTVSRPNVEDALKRVSIVLHKHICTCETRLLLAHFAQPSEMVARCEAATKDGGEADNEWSDEEYGDLVDQDDAKGQFSLSKMELFQEENFITAQYLYRFVRLPIATPGVCYSMQKVRRECTIPTPEEIYSFMRTLFKKACLSSECAIVCLIYVERLMEVARVPLVAVTWRPIVLCGLLLASKVWQDLSSWNVEFSQVYPQFSIQSINRLERLFVNELKWDLYISSSLYAKVYFALRSLYEKPDIRRRYCQVLGINIQPPKADEISARSGAVRRDLQDILSRSF